MVDCSPSDSVVLVQGEDRVLFLRVIDKVSLQPFDLTNASQISARFKKTDDTVLVKNLTSGVSIVSPAAGKISVSLTALDSITLKARDDQSFEIEITVGTGAAARLTVVQFLRVLSVRPRVV